MVEDDRRDILDVDQYREAFIELASIAAMIALLVGRRSSNGVVRDAVRLARDLFDELYPGER